MTQEASLLAALQDGAWHSTAELYRLAGPMIHHSRVSSLRDKGHVIEHRTTGPGASGSWYRLVKESLSEGGEQQAPTSWARASDCAGSPEPPSESEQPSLFPLPPPPMHRGRREYDGRAA